MLEFLKRVYSQMLELVGRVDKKDRRRFIIITLVSLVVIVVALVALSRTTYSVLYTDLDLAEAGEIRQVLTELGVKTQTPSDGTIMVPEKREQELRMELAAQGYPQTGYVYQFLDSSGFNTTESEKSELRKIELQERLRYTIIQNPGVKDCTVTLFMPQTKNVVFESERQSSSASVTIEMMPNAATLNARQVQGIENIVASASGVSPEYITITDNYANPLNHLESTDFSTQATLHEMEKQVADEYNRSILRLLIPIFGAERVFVSTDARLNFDTNEVRNTVFSPVEGNDNNGIVVSAHTLKEKAENTPVTGEEPGFDENGGAPMYPETQTGSDYSYSQTVNDVNYEVNRMEQEIIKQKFIIESLTASVVIDNNELSNDNSSKTDIQAICGGALGMDRNAYTSSIVVSFMTLDGMTASREAQALYDAELKRMQLYELIKVLALYLLIFGGSLIILLRFMKLFKKPKEDDELLVPGVQAEEDEYSELIRLATAEQTPADDIEINKSPIFEKLESFIDKSPDMVATLLRNWLNEESSRGSRK